MDERKMLEHIANVVAAIGSQKKAALALGVSPQYLNDILKGRREISFEVAQKCGYLKSASFKPLPQFLFPTHQTEDPE